MQWIPHESEESLFPLTHRKAQSPDQDNEWLRLFERLLRERNEAQEQLQTLRTVTEQTLVESEEQTSRVERLVLERDEALAQLQTTRALMEQALSEAEEHGQRLEQLQAERNEARAQAGVLLEALDMKDERIAELIDQVAEKGNRVAQLEATLKMLAEADEA